MMSTLLASLPFGLFDAAKRPLFFLLLAFIFTFVVVRVNTRRVRATGGAGTGAGSIVTPGGLHIHHSVFGIVTMVVAGILEFALQPHTPGVEIIACAFGAGAALTLDEFALILHLEDVYWTGEGRQSIDAVILGLVFMILLLTGLVPGSLVDVGDYMALSRWAAFAVLLSSVVFVVTCYLKGKLFMGTVGIFVPPIALIGAVRLAKPESPWAHLRYARSPIKMERARRRHEGFNRRWRERKHVVWDLIGGRPHLHLPHLHAQARGGAAVAVPPSVTPAEGARSEDERDPAATTR
jgi:lysyl-tRNA synthetase class 2